ncbi:hypothetical protein [Jannaschia pohangensis]|uniref:Uncharacterized protein n=1 Tax=Jannaschia pohangensis TaxID=390807 RepID=A0A1I3T4R6_9RHOB|nr:hypothetical protein [Jannaschia pohangensis]SFJ65199.1 hypothetical protein SAMN04488095_3270 [Jannaschia pohangensis]
MRIPLISRAGPAGRGERTQVLAALHQSLMSREMPETVARTLYDHPDLVADDTVKGLIGKRLKRGRTTSMSEGWFEPVHMSRQMARVRDHWATELAASNDPRAAITDGSDPEQIRLFLGYLSERMGLRHGPASFKYDRPTREMRPHILDIGNHAYNKRFRQLNRMYAKLERYARERRFLTYRIVGKAGLVADITPADMARDIWSAAFVAYYAARKRRRSVFTNTSQDRPFDDLCEALLARATNWPLIARVLPEARVMERLSDAEKGGLIGEWTMVLRDIAGDLEALWRDTDINLDTMVVKRGNDSSSWNLTAQAWNTARTGWIATQQAMGMDRVLDHFLPGKVMRLMAGDVAAYHAMTGGDIHPDTKVWADLPFPWEVMRGTATCGRLSIEASCRRHDLDPVKSGWSAARVSTTAVDYAATPELVHGVTVASPEMAAILRKAGWFSGK